MTREISLHGFSLSMDDMKKGKPRPRNPVMDALAMVDGSIP